MRDTKSSRTGYRQIADELRSRIEAGELAPGSLLTRPRSGTAWTDSGEAHDRRGRKHRPRKAVREVPIPPALVAPLRWHVTAYSTAPDGRLFQTARGGLIQDTGYVEVWAEARARTLTPPQRESSLDGG